MSGEIAWSKLRPEICTEGLRGPGRAVSSPNYAHRTVSAKLVRSPILIVSERPVLDVSKEFGPTGADKDPDLLPLRTFGGARSVREVHLGGEDVNEHRHDCLTLTVPLAGGFRSVTEIGEASLSGASVVVHPAGAAHSAFTFDDGLEAVGIHLDPAWLRCSGVAANVDRTYYWIGGRAGAGARRLARAWMTGEYGKSALAAMTARFLSFALAERPPPRPRWLDQVDKAIAAQTPPLSGSLTRKLELHPGWLAQAYRAAKGEGLRETARRKRVERAIALLRRSDCALAEIALQTGFCDQSHMNRAFRALIGRTPLEVRADAHPQIAAGTPA